MMFEFNGKKYLIKGGASKCYENDPPWYAVLPDGVVLKIGGWLETLPPKPTEISCLNFLPGIVPEGAFACEEIQ